MKNEFENISPREAVECTIRARQRGFPWSYGQSRWQNTTSGLILQTDNKLQHIQQTLRHFFGNLSENHVIPNVYTLRVRDADFGDLQRLFSLTNDINRKFESKTTRELAHEAYTSEPLSNVLYMGYTL